VASPSRVSSCLMVLAILPVVGVLPDAMEHPIEVAGRPEAPIPPTASGLTQDPDESLFLTLDPLDAPRELGELPLVQEPPAEPAPLAVLVSGRDPLRPTTGSAVGKSAVETLTTRDDGTVAEWERMAEQDQAEARASATIQGRTLLVGGGLFVLVVLGIAAAVARRADRARTRLQASRERFRALFQNAPTGTARVAVDGRFQEVNPALVELLGYPPGEILTMTVEELTHPEDWPNELGPIGDLLRGRRERFQVRKRYLRADGSVVPARTTVSAVRSPNGRVRYYVAQIEDVSAEEAAKRRTRQALDRLEATLDATPIALFEMNPEGRVLRWNTAAEEVFGWTEDEAVGQVLPSFPRDDMATFHRLRTSILAGGRLDGVEVMQRRKDGTMLPIRAYGGPVEDPDGEVVGIVGLAEDIGDEKEREEELRSLNRALRFVSESNMAVVRSRSREELLERVGRTALETGGYAHVWVAYRRDDGQGLELFQRAPEEGSPLDILKLPDLLDELRGPRAVSVAFVVQSLAGGEERWHALFEERGYGSLAMLPFPETGSEAESGFLVLAHRDPQAFDRAELSVLEELTSDLEYGLGISVLRSQLTLISSAVESLELGVMILNARAEGYPVTFANAGLGRLVGCDPEELLDRPGTWALGPDTDPELRQELEKALEAGRPCQMVLQAHRDSGETFWDRVTVSPVQEEGRELAHLVCIQEDVSEKKRMGEELEHRSRLVAVGELAGGVAHDFRNILTAAQGLAQLSLQAENLPEEIRENLHDLTQVVGRGTAVTERLLALSRRGTNEPRPTPLSTLLTEIVSVVGHTLRDDITLQHDALEDDELHVHLDPDQFTQALFNLVRNAEQAMPRGGRLSLSTTHPVPEAVWDDAPPRAIHGGGEEWVYLSLTDTGVGMDAETLQRAFDPYFTTKPSGEGTGLGLAAVVGVMDRMDGHIWMTSTPGVGTVAHILLPLTEPPEEESAARKDEASLPSRRRTGTILLAEDDPSVLRVFTLGLERLGLEVIPTLDGAEALARFEEDPGAVDVVVTDGIMPHISGAGLASGVWDLRPETPVVVTSGFGSAELRQDFPDAPPGPLVFLPKPLEIEELKNALMPFLSNGTVVDDSSASSPPS